MQSQETVQIVVKVPDEVEVYVKQKLEKNGSGGRPHIISVLKQQGKNPIDELYNILEFAWIKNRSIGSLAKKYGVEYTTIYRLLKDLETSKQQIIDFLLQTPRRKTFYNPETNTSDYETVQNYIRRAKRSERRDYKRYVRLALQCWQFLKYKDPENWSADDVTSYLHSKTPAQQYQILCAIRAVAPQIADKTSQHYISTTKYYDKIGINKKDIFQPEVNLILKALVATHLTFHATVFKLHITLGAREGKKNSKSGMTGLQWDRFKRSFKTVDLWESKVKGGIWSRDCPADLFFPELPNELEQIWVKRGKPISDPVILGSYQELRQIYEEIREALKQHYEGKLEPSVFKELTSIRPHDADKIHVNLCWEAEIPIEVVAGEFLGRGEGNGLVGRIWLTVDVIKKHYLSLNRKTKRFQTILSKVHDYSTGFQEVA